MTVKRKRDLAALATIPLTMTLANSMLIPVLPLMEKKLGISATQASLIITVYAAISILCIPIAGYLSDRFGRKPIILIGLALAAAGGLISTFAAWKLSGTALVYTLILVGRFVQGIGAAGAFPIVLPLVGDMFKSDEEVSSGLGMIETSNTFGKVVSPILGSALALIIWYMPLAVIPAISIISCLAVAFMVKEPAKKDQGKTPSFIAFLSSIKPVLVKNRGWIYATFIIGGLAMYIMFGLLYYLSEVLEQHHQINGIYKGLLLAIPLLAICLASFLGGKIIGKHKERLKWLTVTGTTLYTGSMVALTIINSKSMFPLLALAVVGGVGLGLILPSLDSMIIEGIEKKIRGTITSLYSSMRFIGVAAGPLVTSFLLGKDRLIFIIFAVLGLVCLILALFAIRTSQIKTS